MTPSMEWHLTSLSVIRLVGEKGPTTPNMPDMTRRKKSVPKDGCCHTKAKKQRDNVSLRTYLVTN